MWLLLPIKSEGGIVVIGYHTAHVVIVKSDPTRAPKKNFKSGTFPSYKLHSLVLHRDRVRNICALIKHPNRFGKKGVFFHDNICFKENSIRLTYGHHFN